MVTRGKLVGVEMLCKHCQDFLGHLKNSALFRTEWHYFSGSVKYWIKVDSQKIEQSNSQQRKRADKKGTWAV
jgi:hypothetical protein